MKKALAAILAAGALAIVPSFSSADPITAPEDGPAYVFVDDSSATVEIWQESNSKAGLQRGNGVEFDTKLA